MSAKVFHAPLLNCLEQFEITSIHERTSSASLIDFPGIRIERSFEAILANPEVELVILCTPNALHFTQTKQSLLAGKHVVVEKPFTVTVAEAEELMVLAETRKLTLSVFHNRRWDGDFLWLQSLVNSGVKIYEIDSRFDRFRDQLKGWKEEEGKGNGILYDLGSHLIDQAVCLFGTDLQLLYVDLQQQRKAAKNTDYFEVHFKSKKTKIILKAGMTCSHSHRFKIDTEKGTFLKAQLDGQEAVLKARGIHFSPDDLTQETIVHYSPDGRIEKHFLPYGNYIQFYKEIYACIRKGSQNPVPAVQAIKVMQWIEEIQNFVNKH